LFVDIHLPDRSDQDPHIPHWWVWAGENLMVISSERELVAAGTQRFAFDISDGGHVTLELRNTQGPLLKGGGSEVCARIHIDVDEKHGLPEISADA